MKIGTISLNVNAPDFNYGAVLHSWAFQKFLQKLDYVESTEIIDYTTVSLEGQNLSHSLVKDVLGLHPRAFLYHLKDKKAYTVRYKKFKEFEKSNMIISEKSYTQSSLNSAELDYDCVICESDVIWSQQFFGGKFDKSFFLALDSMKKMKKIAYSPSMGEADLTSEHKKYLKSFLKHIDYISCRESYDIPILKELTDKEVVHVLDPVLLLEEKDYASITADRIIEEKYICLYLPVDDNSELRKQAKDYAERNNLKILEISTKLEIYENESGICSGTMGIQEFLSAIKYADVIFTNSFHAICFAVIFNVEFYAFTRKYPGKVKDICKTLGLLERYLEKDSFNELKRIDYDIVNNKWKELKEKSINWLENALKGIDIA